MEKGSAMTEHPLDERATVHICRTEDVHRELRTISKTTQAIVETFTVRWCKNPFFKVGSFNKIRARAGLSLAKACFICGDSFEESSLMALAHLVKDDGSGSNELLCHLCAEELLEAEK